MPFSYLNIYKWLFLDGAENSQQEPIESPKNAPYMHDKQLYL